MTVWVLPTSYGITRLLHVLTQRDVARVNGFDAVSGFHAECTIRIEPANVP